MTMDPSIAHREKGRSDNSITGSRGDPKPGRMAYSSAKVTRRHSNTRPASTVLKESVTLDHTKMDHSDKNGTEHTEIDKTEDATF